MQNPHRRRGERQDTEDSAALPMSGARALRPATGTSTTPEQDIIRPTTTTPGPLGTKLSLLTRPRRISGTKLAQHEPHGPTSGTKLSQLTRNGSIWRFFDMQGEFCTVLTTKKPSRENFVPNARQRRGSPTQQHTRPHLCGGRRQGLVQTNFACNSKTQVTQRRRPIRTSAMPEGNCMRN